ncbi:MAG: SDR family NAD(P)-dependent oxidoreductase [Lyngbya sp. HA4199-MV5]|jgi:NAD(P)-dependent dehydrogenase (short-subunit alcohol dehydrogenase family)|nr:SDR family NAD(P)-dependent oxidoreductase [Lyngbya sp. HA4199-MV5]
MNSDNKRVNPKVWLITSCSTGFGRALAEDVLQKGDSLLATARKPEQLGVLTDHYSVAKAVRLDVTSSQDIQAAVDAAIATFGYIGVRVNNVGRGLIAALKEVSDGEMLYRVEGYL